MTTKTQTFETGQGDTQSSERIESPQRDILANEDEDAWTDAEWPGDDYSV